MVKQKIDYIKKKGIESLANEGLGVVAKKGVKYIYQSISRKLSPEIRVQHFKDILFINGCDLNHPSRYRVDHQKEQLEAVNITCDSIWYESINLDLLKYYRGFIIFRTPITPLLEEFIEKGKYFNKTFYFDIDDLVIGEEYVNQIEHLKKLTESELNNYMDGVIRNQKTLSLCHYAITTTPVLASELKKFVSDVFVNRNVVSEEMLHLSTLALEAKSNTPAKDEIYIGYLSGSITHNPDFELIKPAVKRVLSETPNVKLVLAGLLNVPEDLAKYSDQIIIKPFVDWRRLPATIASLDINLAPIEDSLFNRAKSENKWTEASIVKVPTIASNVGAFADVIENGITGMLCSSTEDWYDAITKLVKNDELRKKIAKNAYIKATKHHSSIYTGTHLKHFLQKTLKRNFGFVLPGTAVRGGVNVIVKHANFLRDQGFDVTLISDDQPNENVKTVDGELLTFSKYHRTGMVLGYFETLVASLYTTVHFVDSYDRCKNRLYFVQNFETDFFVAGDPRKSQANATYNTYNVKAITISKWCQNWLLDTFGTESKYCPNGMNLDLFKVVKKDFSGKIRILIEGNSVDEYKNVDESFLITNELDRSKFEIWYLLYDKKPKSWYKFDKFFHQIPFDEVAKIYQDCHIIVKSSKVESFSYPPLEMMATGGVAIVAANGGNAEFVAHRSNCMVYEVGDIETARGYIFEVLEDRILRETLIKNGRQTAVEREWKNIEPEILSLYK